MDLSTHRHTPSLSVIDPRGLPVRTVAFHRREAQHTAQAQVTRQCYDAAGRSAGQWDPRLFALWLDDDAIPPNQSAVYGLSGQALATDSVDAGWRVQFFGDRNQALSLWDSRLTRSRIEYDAMLRPTALFEQGADEAEQCRERLIYGGNNAEDHAYNRCGQLIQHDDSAGRQFMPSYSLAGQLLEQGRQFLTAMTSPHWPNAELEGQRFLTTWDFDALGGTLQQTDALGHQQRWRHDIAGQLMLSQVARPETQPYTVLHRCAYDVSGQLLEQTAGNGVISRNTYESATGRLSRRCSQKADGTLLQDLHYRYDPVGNVVQIDDASKTTRFFRNQRIDPTSTYTYDTLYQLIAATGREVASATYGPGLPSALDANNLVNYRETYDYDSAGNLQQLQHMGGQSWTLRMVTARHSNRSLGARNGELPGEPEIAAGFDENGNLRALQPGQTLTWNLRNQLQQVSPVERLSAANDSEHYLYDSGGQRVRKLRISQAANVEHQADVRYLPGLEIRRDSAVASGQSLYVIVAQGVRMLHWEHGLWGDQWRYSLTDHLGSSTLELDEHAALLTEEGYTPFGSTAWWAAKSETEARDKTVRYSGKECDATGLYYYGFRYYAPWLCRWVSPDPAGDVDGLNLFRMVRNSPLCFVDPDGHESVIPQIAHYIWLGGTLPDYARSNIVSFQAVNQDWQVNVWSDHPARLRNNMIDQGLSETALNRINIVNVNNALDNAPAHLRRDLSGAYVREVSGPYRNYAAASDLLRLAVLYQQGGLYMDTDIHVSQDSPLGSIQSRQSPASNVLFAEIGDGGQGNHLIASEPGAHGMGRLLARAVDSYVRDISVVKRQGGYFTAAPDDDHFRGDIFEEQDEFDIQFIWENKRSFEHSGMGRTMLTQDMTGPNLINEYLFTVRRREDSKYRIQGSNRFGTASELSPTQSSRAWHPGVRPAGEWTRPGGRQRRTSI